MPEEQFTENDLKSIKKIGLTARDISSQIETMKGETIPLKLAGACSVGDGIVDIPSPEWNTLISEHDQAAAQGRMIKFVPASGAASRMFRRWFTWYETDGFSTTGDAGVFQKQLPRFAFFDDLSRVLSQDGRDIRREDPREILAYILTRKGLNYAHLPKALLKFHAYPDRNRTPLEEHLVEAALYVRDENHICRLHITVSGEHLREVEEHLAQMQESYETKHRVSFEIALSIQEPSTDTIAVDFEGRPFRDEAGRLVFRPGGHGALLKNLNRIEEDIIFIKNIDNVVPDRLKPDTVLHKKILGGYLVTVQEAVFRHLRRLSDGEQDDATLSEIEIFCRERLFRTPPSDFQTGTRAEKKRFLFDILNRPLRVCGMVKNEGEPGGGPFWIEEPNGTRSLQIVEEVQVAQSKQQRTIWESSTYFNPVDLVCGIRDFRGEKFDLERYVDSNTRIIAHKSYEGRPLKALELPGLWNGSMARWNTIFVTVPSITFNPVKTVDDLLRGEHSGGIEQQSRDPS